jgi:hypothetical protein
MKLICPQSIFSKCHGKCDHHIPHNKRILCEEDSSYCSIVKMNAGPCISLFEYQIRKALKK